MHRQPGHFSQLLGKSIAPVPQVGFAQVQLFSVTPMVFHAHSTANGGACDPSELLRGEKAELYFP
jgi:hypothetical protein